MFENWTHMKSSWAGFQRKLEEDAIPCSPFSKQDSCKIKRCLSGKSFFNFLCKSYFCSNITLIFMSGQKSYFLNNPLLRYMSDRSLMKAWNFLSPHLARKSILENLKNKREIPLILSLRRFLTFCFSGLLSGPNL